jgi:hypothetical protein
MLRLTRNARALLAQVEDAIKKLLRAKTEETRLRSRKVMTRLMKNGLKRPKDQTEAVAILVADFLETQLSATISSRVMNPFSIRKAELKKRISSEKGDFIWLTVPKRMGRPKLSSPRRGM